MDKRPRVSEGELREALAILCRRGEVLVPLGVKLPPESLREEAARVGAATPGGRVDQMRAARTVLWGRPD